MFLGNFFGVNRAVIGQEGSQSVFVDKVSIHRLGQISSRLQMLSIDSSVLNAL